MIKKPKCEFCEAFVILIEGIKVNVDGEVTHLLIY